MPGTTPDNLLAIERLYQMIVKHPELRLCQLIGNAVPAEEAKRLNNDLYYVEDKQLIGWLDDFDHQVQAAATEEAAGRR